MTHPRKEPRGKWVGYFDKLCALCDAVLPDFPEERLIRIGWTQDFDGAWICPREHTVHFANGSSLTFGRSEEGNLEGMEFHYLGIELPEDD